MVHLLDLDASCILPVEDFENRLILDLIDGEIIRCHY